MGNSYKSRYMQCYNRQFRICFAATYKNKTYSYFLFSLFSIIYSLRLCKKSDCVTDPKRSI